MGCHAMKWTANSMLINNYNQAPGCSCKGLSGFLRI
jgi:hypothetical protein